MLLTAAGDFPVGACGNDGDGKRRRAVSRKLQQPLDVAAERTARVNGPKRRAAGHARHFKRALKR